MFQLLRGGGLGLHWASERCNALTVSQQMCADGLNVEPLEQTQDPDCISNTLQGCEIVSLQ